MTVKELKQKLDKFPDDHVVILSAPSFDTSEPWFHCFNTPISVEQANETSRSILKWRRNFVDYLNREGYPKDKLVLLRTKNSDA